MANFLMNPVVPGLVADVVTSQTKLVSQQEGASFASYIDKKSAELDIGRNMFGLKGKQPVEPQATKGQGSASDEQAVASIAELLKQFMVQLHDLAEKKDIGAGEWQLTGFDSTKLANLAEKAGMESSEMAALISKTDDGGEALGLVDFFSSLEQTFSQIDQPKPVIAPETSLPLLQTILSKLGVSESDIIKISESSVDDFGGFDLNIFLDGLNGLETPLQPEAAAVPLTAWQTEQLQNMLESAGLTQSTELQLFPEKSFEIFAGVEILKESLTDQGPTVQMGLDRLKSMLQQTVNDSESVQPKVDLPAFLGELQNVLGQANFKDGGVGWSPVVQDSIASVFEELQKIVDFSQIKIKSGDGGYLATWDENLGVTTKVGEVVEGQQPTILNQKEAAFTSVGHVAAKDVIFPKATDSPLGSVENAGKASANLVELGMGRPEVVSKANIERGAGFNAGSLAEEIQGEEEIGAQQKDSQKTGVVSADSKTILPDGEKSKNGNIVSIFSDDLTQNNPKKNLKQDATLAMPHLVADEIQEDVGKVKASDQSHSPTRPPLKQSTFEQISTGVLRGLRESQRHLTMTLHPKELGEVKVDMLLRENQLSLSFLMETPKVKELLESTMQDLRQNMSQNGFELGQCSVSVGQNNDSELPQHQFASDRHNMNERARKVGLAEINDIVAAAGNELRSSYHNSQISVIA